MGLTERVARTCANHPWLTLGAWGLTLAGAVAALVLVMTGLTTEASSTNNPESERADDRLIATFPPDPRRAVTDLVVVRSDAYTVDQPRFRAFVAELAREGRETGAVAGAQTYYATGDRSLVSSDRHATLVPLFIDDEDQTADVIEVVERGDEDADFAVAITGSTTRDNDFNELSERDLQNGELKFGLPAALVILLLVFGAVVAGLIPLLMAMFSIVTALGLVAVLSQPFELSVFIVNMLTGMGLALGIDYSLFVVSRVREERARGASRLDAISRAGGLLPRMSRSDAKPRPVQDACGCSRRRTART